MLFDAADTLWERIGKCLFGYADLVRWSREIRDAVRDAAGSKEFDARRSIGARMTPEPMLAYALAEPGPPGGTEEGPETDGSSVPPLTRRQREVAGLVAAGLSNREIAERLVVSVRTAEAHVESILSKIGFSSRTQIVRWLAAADDGQHGDDGRPVSR